MRSGVILVFMVSFIESVVLGVVQGLTEWLPVSSSGHLALVKGFFGLELSVLFYVLLHLGTLVVVAAFFRRDIVEILRAFARRDFGSEWGRLGAFVVVGSVPTAIIGYVFKGLFESFFDNLLVVGVALFATGFLLFVSERKVGDRTLGYLDSVFVGIAQGIAIIPGVSRSGATISTGLLRGVKREMAFRFSFLLSIPAVLGAMVAELGDWSLLVSEVDVVPMAAGIVASMIVVYLSLRVLQKLIISQKFHWFAFYCWAAGILVIISQML
jgi:undecaprenyl-diphosphatase